MADFDKVIRLIEKGQHPFVEKYKEYWDKKLEEDDLL